MCKRATQPLMRKKSGKKPTIRTSALLLLTEPGLSRELCTGQGEKWSQSWALPGNLVPTASKDFFAE